MSGGRKRSHQVSFADEAVNGYDPDVLPERDDMVADAMTARQEAHRADMAHRMQSNQQVDQAVLLQLAQEDEFNAAEMMVAAEALQRQMEENAAIEAQVEQYTAQLLEEAALEEMRMDDT